MVSGQSSLFLHPLRFLLCRFIFLFRWTEERRARRKVIETAAEIFVKDEEKVNSIFFAQQVGECKDFARRPDAMPFIIIISFLRHSTEQLRHACFAINPTELSRYAFGRNIDTSENAHQRYESRK